MQSEFVTYLLELLADVDHVTARRMFGGHGIFRDGLMFGLVADDVFYLKVDDGNRADFEERGLEPFCYQKQGRLHQIAYHQAPEEVFDDTAIMVEWAAKAYAAALRARQEKQKPLSTWCARRPTTSRPSLK